MEDGSPYGSLWLTASEGERGTWLTFTTSRYDEPSNSEQWLDWSFRVPADAIDISNDLERISIHTGDALGSFGVVDLDMRDHHRERRRSLDCPETGERLNSSIRQMMSMQGQVGLSLGLSEMSGPFTGTEARGSARRVTFTGAACPRERRCYPGAAFGAIDDEIPVALSATRQGWIDIVTGQRSWAKVTVAWTMWYSLDGNPVTITHDAVTIDASTGTPFLDGSLAFERSGPPEERRWGPCRLIQVPFALTAGSLEFLWDTGTVTLDGPWEASLDRWRRP
jgi:hypothetical protein